MGLAILLAMSGFAALGFVAIRRDVENLREISQDNILWSATQMEVELLRFEISIASLGVKQTPDALDEVRERFDILWSRVHMLGKGRVGELLRLYDEGHGSVDAIVAYLQGIDAVIANLQPTDVATVKDILDSLHGFQHSLRLYTLRVVRADTARTAAVRDRIQSSAQTTAFISLAAVLLSALSLTLIQRENRRQHQLADINRKQAEDAKLASRAKSRFLSMMSHELRNPLNGILGPLALLSQSNLPQGQVRLVTQAKSCGQSMLQMLAGLLDYAEIQDGHFRLRPEPFPVASLASAIKEGLADGSGAGMPVRVASDVPDRILGDKDRLSQIFQHLCEYVLDLNGPEDLALELRHDGRNLVGTIELTGCGSSADWKLDILMGLGEMTPNQVSADALRPLIARGLLAASGGVLDLESYTANRRAIRVTVPAEPVAPAKIRVRLETRSGALAAIYRAALKSDRVIFVANEDVMPADFVLVDSTGFGEEPLITRLRERNPKALFVSLGRPESPGFFDDIVETPNDMGQLRKSILGRLAS
jgi:signal transduction histidine kinase